MIEKVFDYIRDYIEIDKVEKYAREKGMWIALGIVALFIYLIYFIASNQ